MALKKFKLLITFVIFVILLFCWIGIWQWYCILKISILLLLTPSFVTNQTSRFHYLLCRNYSIRKKSSLTFVVFAKLLNIFREVQCSLLSVMISVCVLLSARCDVRETKCIVDVFCDWWIDIYCYFLKY